MSVELAVSAVYRVTCNHDGCTAVHVAHVPSEHWARLDAEKHDWQPRPFAGKGSRTGPDLCPKHRDPVCEGCGEKILDGQPHGRDRETRDWWHVECRTEGDDDLD